MTATQPLAAPDSAPRQPPGSAPARATGLALGVVVPCHNEAAVIERKLRNLARCAWPALPDGRQHMLLVVDDGSDDDTASLARDFLAAHFSASGPVRAQLLPNAVRPGKSGAIETALRALRPTTDLVVLTDADVIVRPASLGALAAAFEARAALGMACGAQEFVRDLHADGTCRGADGGAPVPAADVFDRATARVRRIESRGGRLFSVHGQLLAWRAEFELLPTPGIAADDLDLMFQVRQRGAHVELLRDAAFLEVKTHAPQAKASQELRRARAYVQVMQGRRSRKGASLADRVQLLFYRRAPLAAPVLVSGWAVPIIAALAALLLLAADRSKGPVLLSVALAGLALLLSLPVLALATRRGRQVVHLLQVIAAAKRLQQQSALTDRWEMARH